MNTKQSDKPIANPICVLREEFDDWAVLFNPDTAEAVGVSPVGVETWKLMDGNRDLDALVAGIREHFSEVPDAVGAEITTFIDDLTERGFVGYEFEATVHPLPPSIPPPAGGSCDEVSSTKPPPDVGGGVGGG